MTVAISVDVMKKQRVEVSGKPYIHMISRYRNHVWFREIHVLFLI